MKVRIHRGTKEIGGTCIELAAAGDRLVLDYGLPLDGDPSDESLVPEVGGNDLMAVVISHPHIDHYGLLHHLPEGVDIAIGGAARRVIRAAAPFTGQAIPPLTGPDLVDGRALIIGAFRITPYLVDHSAYDAYSLLIEAEGKRLFYSGDFRAHGRKANLFDRFVANPPTDIDVLLMEGTSLSRLDADEVFPTEDELENQLVKHFKAAKGLVMFHTSAQNIDRIVTLYRACKRTGKPLIIDLYTAAILAATANTSIPQADWPGILFYVPKLQVRQIKRNGWFDLLTRHSSNRIYPEQLKNYAANAVMLFRPLMMSDLDQCLSGASFIYSQWAGYLERGTYLSTEAWLKQKDIEISFIHTSGHASPRDLRRYSDALAPRSLVPIHSFATEKFHEQFSNVKYRNDGDWWDA